MTTTKYKPILFSSPMVRALLDGRKTQTRRVIKPEVWEETGPDGEPNGLRWSKFPCWEGTPEELASLAPYHVGDVLWVRETLDNRKERETLVYAADHMHVKTVPLGTTLKCKVIPSIHMPRWAARLFLEVVDVRAQRVQEISEEDARAEGCEPNLIRVDPIDYPYRAGFSQLWDSIHGPGAWARNDWVWVYTFKPAAKPENWA